MSRRVHVSRTKVERAVHYLEQYHGLAIVWFTRTVARMDAGQAREEFRSGVQDIFNELQVAIADLREELGDTPETITDAIGKLKGTDEYKRLLDKVQVQALRNIVEDKWTPKAMAKRTRNRAVLAWDWTLTKFYTGLFHVAKAMKGSSGKAR